MNPQQETPMQQQQMNITPSTTGLLVGCFGIGAIAGLIGWSAHLTYVALEAGVALIVRMFVGH